MCDDSSHHRDRAGQAGRLFGGRPRVVKIAESTVMGRTPVIVLATVLAVVGLAQVTGDNAGSNAVSRYGGNALDLAWAACLIVAAALIWIARLRHNHLESAAIETLGIFLIDVGLIVYLVALGSGPNQFQGGGLILGMVVSTVINITGRAALLHTRTRELRKAIR